MAIRVRPAVHRPDTVLCPDDTISDVETIIINQWNLSMVVKYYHIFSNETIITQWPLENHRLVEISIKIFGQNFQSKFSVEILSRKFRSNFWANFSVEIFSRNISMGLMY